VKEGRCVESGRVWTMHYKMYEVVSTSTSFFKKQALHHIHIHIYMVSQPFVFLARCTISYYRTTSSQVPLFLSANDAVNVSDNVTHVAGKLLTKIFSDDQGFAYYIVCSL
jgi:hypothetical protein